MNLNEQILRIKGLMTIKESDVAGVDELVYNPVTGNPKDQSEYGSQGGKQGPVSWAKHDDHLHVGANNKQVMMSIIDQATKMGLSSTENPYAKNDPNKKVDSVHANNSYHYRVFEGEPLVGAGVDISGDQEKLRNLVRWINNMYSNKSISVDKTTTTNPGTDIAQTQSTNTNGDYKNKAIAYLKGQLSKVV